MSNKQAKRWMQGSFWLIMAIHAAVFTAIGLFTSRWGLLVLFLCCLAAMLALGVAVRWLIKKYRK
jgi:hypothetical protein